MKLLTIFGTRPEIIRLSQVIKRLDSFCEHVLVHTGQNNDPNLSDIFLKGLSLRRPDIHFGIKIANFPEQVARIMQMTGKVLIKEKPDKVLVLGDTNSGLGAVVAARMGIPVYHMEAGNRCYDTRVPEEINRRIIDHASTILMPYTHRSKENLLAEGFPRQRIFVIGNPIFEVIKANAALIKKSTITKKFHLGKKDYFLVTLHRAENVNDISRLKDLLQGLALVADKYKKTMIVSLHPHTADRLDTFSLKVNSSRIRLTKPLGFHDFIKLEQDALCVLTDSGTVQEECCIFRVPNVTLRDVTERPETVECGSNILSGSDPKKILQAVEIAVDSGNSWVPPAEYLMPSVSDAVVKVILSC